MYCMQFPADGRSSKTGSNRLLSQRVFEQLEARIVEHAYPPGTHLAEDEIAAGLGVSRTPVREAFKILQRAGWLELQPHAGAYVRTPALDEVRQVFEVRQCLEERAAALSAAHIDPREIKDLKRIIERGTREVRRGNVKQATALNSAFHATIARASRNQILGRLLEDLGKQVRWHLSTVAVARGMNAWREHEEILDAIARGDAETAGRKAMEHSHRTQEAFFLQFVRFSSEGVMGAAASSDGARSRRPVER
jgi:DNA-binding GntR family transcriptional regulator